MTSGEIPVLTNVEVNERNREVFFTMNHKSKYKIPSKMFPLASKKNNAVFTTETTTPFEHETFNQLINQLSLEIGACYTNTEILRQVAEKLGLDSYFFSGWVFRGHGMPIHHAWLVIRDENGNASIVDSLKENLFRKAIESLPKEEEFNRKAYSLAVKETSKKFPLNTQQIIIGQVLKGFIYVGAEDEYENAKKTFRDLTSKFPNHPSYKGEGFNTNGRSKLQEELSRIGIK